MPESKDVESIRSMLDDFVPLSSRGQKCPCGKDACRKVEEVIFPDDPFQPRHPFTQYLCLDCFKRLMFKSCRGDGDAVLKDKPLPYDGKSTCSSCIWYDKTGGRYCRYNAPVLVDGKTQWPMVDKYSWCSKHPAHQVGLIEEEMKELRTILKWLKFEYKVDEKIVDSIALKLGIDVSET